MLLAIGIYFSTWKCYNPIISTIKLSDHFNYSYGFAFAIIGYVASSLIFVVSLVCLSSSDDVDCKVEPSPAKTIGKVAGGAVGGLSVAGIAIVITLACNDAFKSDPPVDPTVNPCAGQKPASAGPGDHYFSDVDCMKDNVVQVLEQAGANVTRGYKGLLDAGDRVPITSTYDQTDLCPVNVHWHLGAEHLSVGQFDGNGKGPVDGGSSHGGDSSPRRQLAGSDTRLGHRCHHYNAADPKFADTYTWESCTNMMVGETYEIHWPHSAAGACGTQWQMQSPFVRMHAYSIPALPAHARARACVTAHLTTPRALVLSALFSSLTRDTTSCILGLFLSAHTPRAPTVNHDVRSTMVCSATTASSRSLRSTRTRRSASSRRLSPSSTMRRTTTPTSSRA